MQPDNRTGLLETATGSPLLKIDSSSTLFTEALGYTAADMIKQNPFTHLSSGVTKSCGEISLFFGSLHAWYWYVCHHMI
eukprot:COSAG01_NODE_63401_length_280_cov_0.574586_1_plen_78_part_01